MNKQTIIDIAERLETEGKLPRKPHKPYARKHPELAVRARNLIVTEKGRAYVAAMHRRQNVARLESEFGMTPDEFMTGWKNGTVPDTFESNYLATLLSDEKGV